MKKGLRLAKGDPLSFSHRSMSRPDEEGITTGHLMTHILGGNAFDEQT